MLEILKIKKLSDGKKAKAEIIYKHDGQQKVSQRRLWYWKDSYGITIKGFDYLVKFDKDGNGYDIKIKGVDLVKESEVEVKEPEVLIKKANTEKIKKEIKSKQQIKHYAYETIKTCVEANIPVYLYGPAGSGKNHVLQQIADELGLEFYFTNSVQQEYKITGFIDANGDYHETEFFRAFTKGGLFFLDEIDASIPEVLVLLNAALANGYFEFPGHGKIDAHPDFRVVAAGNTVGSGANEQYTGRLQLDQATLDRFVMIEFDYDINIELHLANGNKELVEFIRDLRNQAKEMGINATFSYRCITMVTKLEGKMNLIDVIKIAVTKGLDMDTIRTFKTTPTSKYSKALWALAKRAS